MLLYTLYDWQSRWLEGASSVADFQAQWLGDEHYPWARLGGSELASALAVWSLANHRRGKPAFGFTEVEHDGRRLEVREEVVDQRPFGDLKRFAKFAADGTPVTGQPKLLIVAPMSGHYATLLRGTAARMLGGYDLHITDWADARDVPLSDGRFDLDDYIDYLIAWLEQLGTDAHMLAVCQPSVPSLAAVALLNAAGSHFAPRTLTMMGGPIDTREAPTAVNTLATGRPHAWFKELAIQTVPAGYRGVGRQVYPGFLQLAGFLSMNLGNHMLSHWELFKHLVRGDGDSADATKAFYTEYRSVCDMTAEFYLQTVDTVFQRHALAKGEMTHRGQRVDVGAITRTALLAIEGERDDISGVGQTRAALTLATGLAETDKRYFLAPKVGHYGIFNGSRWRNEIAPVVDDWIARHAESPGDA